MSSRFPRSLSSLTVAAGALAAALLAGCDRTAEAAPSPPDGASASAPSTDHDIVLAQAQQRQQAQPSRQGGQAQQASASDIEAGKMHYMAYNCIGCHFMGAGGIGPALMDDTWIYGGEIDQIKASIAEGRPNGMPAWAGKIPDDQISQIAAFVKSLQSDAPKPTKPPAATIASADGFNPKPRMPVIVSK